MVRKLIILALYLCIPTASACWFTWSEDWGNVHISRINYENVEPTAEDTAPDDITVKLPITVWVDVKESDLWSIAVNYVELQYKVEGETGWISLDLVYDDESRNYEFTGDQRLFGSGIIDADTASVDPGDTILIRLYIANYDNGVKQYENAAKASDTTKDGTNGWLGEWVVRMILDTGSRPSW